MNYLLIVDDSPMDLHLARSILEKKFQERIKFASNGWEALEQIEDQLPLAVITDLQMSELDGLQLTERIHQRFPSVPVILMAAAGSEETAAEALERGAVDFVPKSMLADELCQAVQSVLVMSAGSPRDVRLNRHLQYEESQFCLDNDGSLIPPLVSHLQQLSRQVGLFNDTQAMRLAKALTEGIRNAIYHGNLELTPDEWSAVRSDASARQIVAKRLQDPAYSSRRVQITSRLSPELAQIVIRDEGRGFNTQSLPNITSNPGQLSNNQRRGLVLIQAFCDEVRYNEQGNELTLIKRRESGEKPAMAS